MQCGAARRTRGTEEDGATAVASFPLFLPLVEFDDAVLAVGARFLLEVRGYLGLFRLGCLLEVAPVAHALVPPLALGPLLLKSAFLDELRGSVGVV